jgi:hypothetical protein
MTLKETERARVTHILSGAEGVTSQDIERKRAGEGHSLSVERRGSDKSGQRGKLGGCVALTYCRAQREAQIRTPKETEWARVTHDLSSIERGTSQDTKKSCGVHRGTHILLSTEGGTSQDTERNRVGEILTNCRAQRRDKSRHRKAPSGQGALTYCRAQRKGQVRTPKATVWARGTHILSRIAGETN